MAAITCPEDTNQAVVLLPDGQNPFGDACPVNRVVQSVFYHYEVGEDAVSYLSTVGFNEIRHFKRANPDGTPRQKGVFKQIIETNIENPLVRDQIEDAFRRILRSDPLAAIAPPPSRKSKRPALFGDAATGSSSTAKESRSKRKKKDPAADDSDSSSDDSSDDDDDDDDDDDSKSRKEAKRAMRSGNVEALFDHIGSEVCLLCRLAVRCLHAALFLFICFEPRMVVYGVNAGVLIWLKASPVGIIVSMGCLCYFNICAMRSSSLSLG